MDNGGVFFGNILNIIHDLSMMSEENDLISGRQSGKGLKGRPRSPIIKID